MDAMQESIEDLGSIKQYLLGELPHDRMKNIEERLLADGEFFEELLVAEEELIDQYLGGTLSKAERALFEKHFLSSPERRQQLRFARAFRRYVDTARMRDALGSGGEVTALWWRRPSGLVHLKSPVAAISLAAVVLLAVLIGAWSISTLRKSRTGPAQPPTVVATLTPGLTRDSGVTQSLSIPAGVGIVELRLRLTTGEYQSYRATIQTDQSAEILAEDKLQPEPSETGSVLVLKVRADLLPRGDYQVKVEGWTNAAGYERTDRYTFRIS
jgi:hypothetical protein